MAKIIMGFCISVALLSWFCAENSMKKFCFFFKIYIFEGIFWRAGKQIFSCPVLSCGNLNVLLRSRERWMIVQRCLNFFSGVGGDNDTAVHPHAMDSPHPMPIAEYESLLMWLWSCLG